jgi:hypothetical protein
MNPSSPFPETVLKIEKVLIGLPFVSILLYYIATGNIDMRPSSIYPVVLGIQAALAVFYILITQNYRALFLTAYLLINAGHWMYAFSYQVENAWYCLLAGLILQAGLAGYLGYKTVRESIANKDWEMFGTLLTLALLFPLLNFLVLSYNPEYTTIYYFTLAFLLGTILYNNNLWEKYDTVEKKILIFLLVNALIEVLLTSLRLI